MGRNIRSTLPVPNSSLLPMWPYIQEFQQTNKRLKQQQKTNYDRRHRVRDLPEIPNNTGVWVTTDGHPVPIISAGTPRSYIVETPTGETRRNRSQINIAPPTTTDRQSEDNQKTDHTTERQVRSPIMTWTRTRTTIVPPDRLS